MKASAYVHQKILSLLEVVAGAVYGDCPAYFDANLALTALVGPSSEDTIKLI